MGIHEFFTTIADRLSGKMRRLCTGLVCLMVVFLLCLNANYVVEQFRLIDPASYISGRVGRDDYIERFRHEYPAIQFANRNLSEKAKILCLFLGERQYYSDRGMIFDEGFFYHAVSRAKSLEEIQNNLKKRGITHLLVRYDLFIRWSDTNFDNKEKDMVQNLFNRRLTLRFSKGGYGLFEIQSH